MIEPSERAVGLMLAPGLRLVPNFLSLTQQQEMLAAVRTVLDKAPLFQPVMPGTGRPLTVRMSNCGTLGWVADRHGYRYAKAHPDTGHSWPPIPDLALRAWAELADYPEPPEACLVNYYGGPAKMGLHQDRDEENLVAPVVSLSLGDTAVFRFGGTERRAPTRSVKIASGDAVVIGGEARLAFHGIDRVLGGSSTLLREGGRFNLTLRRVTGATFEHAP